MMRLFKKVLSFIFDLLVAVILICATYVIPKKRNKLIWGIDPILNIKYWSHAVRGLGYESVTVVNGIYNAINKNSDFDIIITDLMPSFFKSRKISRIVAFLFIIRNASVFHISFSGGPISRSSFWRLEGYLLKKAGIRVVVIPYGSDIWMYSKVVDPCVRHGLLSCYPKNAMRETQIEERVRYWERYADVVLSGFIVDGRGSWSVTGPNFLAIDVESLQQRKSFSRADGATAPVRIVHAPNHRDYKGTEFLFAAVERLQEEGLSIELIILEKVQNDRVKEIMRDADILADQFINTGYGLAAVEGMASGLAVVGNLDLEFRTRIFRRYAFLDECPIVSSPPERLADTLRTLVTNPALRKTLGMAGRHYVEKYHSYEAARYLFGSIYDKILHQKDVDLINLFHPLKSEYMKQRPRVAHPLIDSRLPTGRKSTSRSRGKSAARGEDRAPGAAAQLAKPGA